MTDEIKEAVEEKAHLDIQESDGTSRYTWLPSGIISFAEFDAMEEANEQALQVKNEASLLKAMIENIMNLEPEEGQDKPQMIVDVTTEFAARVQDVSKEVEVKEKTVSKEDHYKAVMEDDTLVKDSDFEDGCSHCGFGDKDIVKSFEKCPYCWNEVG